MSVDKTISSLPIYAASFNSSGNWTAPTTSSKIYVALKGASGGNSAQYSNSGGQAALGGAYVAVAGGSTYSVVLGAVGNSNAAGGNCLAYGSVPTRYSTTIACVSYSPPQYGNAGGTSTWDSNAIIVYGASGANAGGNGTDGSVAFETSLPPLYPTGASARVSGSTATIGNAGSGQAFVFTV